jgi:uncharacterized protein (TIGR00266 family)
MEHEILYRPSYSLLKIRLRQGEAVSAEAGAMVSMSSSIEIKTAAKGGIFGALKRSVLGGESFFVNTFMAADSGEVTFAPTLPGDIHALELKGQSFYAQSGAYIASSPDIQVDTKWGGAKTFFSREGLFLLKMNSVKRVGGLKSTLFSGEGLVCELTGPGKIYIQTRSADAFLAWLIPQIPKKE